MKLTEETVKPYLFTKVEFSDDGHEWSEPTKLIGFDGESKYPFYDGGDIYKHIRLPKKVEKRLMTGVELLGKVLWVDGGPRSVLTDARYSASWVKAWHNYGYQWSELGSDEPKSFMIEVSE